MSERKIAPYKYEKHGGRESKLTRGNRTDTFRAALCSPDANEFELITYIPSQPRNFSRAKSHDAKCVPVMSAYTCIRRSVVRYAMALERNEWVLHFVIVAHGDNKTKGKNGTARNGRGGRAMRSLSSTEGLYPNFIVRQIYSAWANAEIVKSH